MIQRCTHAKLLATTWVLLSTSGWVDPIGTSNLQATTSFTLRLAVTRAGIAVVAQGVRCAEQVTRRARECCSREPAVRKSDSGILPRFADVIRQQLSPSVAPTTVIYCDVPASTARLATCILTLSAAAASTGSYMASKPPTILIISMVTKVALQITMKSGLTRPCLKSTG